MNYISTKVTLKDVARIAGVSRTTVSLVINGYDGPRVSKITKKKVLGAVKDLNFNPNPIAQRLALRKTNSIGVFIPFVSPVFRNYAVVEMISGIQEITSKYGFDLILLSSGKSINIYPSEIISKQKNFDGLIICNTRYTTNHFNNKIIAHLKELHFNFVIVHYYWGTEHIKYVGVDYEKDTFNSVSYLASIGHKRIALITGLPQALVTSKIIRGYRKALKSNGININENLIESGNYDSNITYKKTQSLINKNSNLTAIFVADYEMAFASLKAIKDWGLNVPKDISLIAYVDHELSPFLDPPLTAVKLPYYEMGKKAATLLLEDNSIQNRVIFDTELIIRGSTIPV